MNKNYSNNNTKDTAMNDNKEWNGIDFSGLRAVFHYQYFQMVDLLMQCYRRSMCGLNLCTLPCAPPKYQEEINKMNAKCEEKILKPNLAKLKQGWKMCINKKGKKNKNNKKSKVEETAIDEN